MCTGLDSSFAPNIYGTTLTYTFYCNGVHDFVRCFVSINDYISYLDVLYVDLFPAVMLDDFIHLIVVDPVSAVREGDTVAICF